MLLNHTKTLLQAFTVGILLGLAVAVIDHVHANAHIPSSSFHFFDESPSRK